jgi:HEPN domain-containing protein
MSMTERRQMALRWLKTSVDDLEAAKTISRSGFHSHACFLCQQAAEKAVKAVFYAMGEDPWGHSIQKLLADLSKDFFLEISGKLVECAGKLDRFYIPARYPNGLPDLTPHEVYFQEDSQEAIAMASSIIEFCREKLVSQGVEFP